MAPTRIHELLALRAAQTPDAVFLHAPRRATSYATLQSLADAATQDLLDAGVRPPDRVLLMAENCAEHIALIMGCSRVGAWSCGVNARMSAGEIAAIVERADARLCYYTRAASDAAQQRASGGLDDPGCDALRTAPRRHDRTRPSAGRHRRDHLHLRHFGHAQGRDGVASRPAALRPRLGAVPRAHARRPRLRLSADDPAYSERP